MAKRKLKIMIASTIHGFEDQLEQICATLKSYGFEVWNSHIKTIPVNPGLSNTANCIEAVKNCDAFFGIIRPQYGAVLDGETSITHQEMLKAIELKVPRWFIAHRDVTIARQLFKQYMYLESGKPNPLFVYKRTSVIDDIRVINLYNDTILNDLPPEERIGHWVDEYFKIGDILRCLETQFSDVNRVGEIVEYMKNMKV